MSQTEYNPYAAFRRAAVSDSVAPSTRPSLAAPLLFEVSPGSIRSADPDKRIPFKLQGFLTAKNGPMATYWHPQENQVNLAEDPAYPY